MLVGEAMSRDFLAVNDSDCILKIGDDMDRRQVGAAVVLRDGAFTGVISKETFAAKVGRFGERSLDSLKVSDLMERDVDTLKEDQDLMAAVDILSTQKRMVDRLPVLSGGKVVGVLSKSALITIFAKRMRGKYRVSDLMSYNPVTVFDYTPLSEVVEEMRTEAVKRVLVLSGETLVGIISVRDVSLALFRERKRNRLVDPTSILKAEDIMTRNLVTVRGGDDAAKAADTMVERHIGGLPVVDHKLEGIVTRTDLLKGFQLSGRV